MAEAVVEVVVGVGALAPMCPAMRILFEKRTGKRILFKKSTGKRLKESSMLILRRLVSDSS